MSSRSEFLVPIPSEMGNLSPTDRETLQKLLGSVTDLPPEFRSYLTNFVLQEIVPQIPIRQTSGSGSLVTSAAASDVTFTPDGSISATNVQDAIVEVRDEAGSGSGSFSFPYAKVSDQKAQNTSGGTFTSGAWRTRTLNTEDSDVDGILSLASNQVTLSAGTYLCRISAPGFQCNRHVARLYNTTDSSVVLLGSSQFATATSGDGNDSLIVGKFTIAAGKALEVQHQCETTKATYGFGVESNFEAEVYAQAEFWRLPDAGFGNAGVGTTIASLPDAPANGAMAQLRLGSSPYHFVQLIYDTTAAKWVTAAQQIDVTTNAPSTTTSTSYGNFGDGTNRGFVPFAKLMYDAGLRPEVMIWAFMLNSGANNSYVQAAIYEASDGDTALTSLGTAGEIIHNGTTAEFHVNSGWTGFGALTCVDDHWNILLQRKVAAGTGTFDLMHLWLRWTATAA